MRFPTATARTGSSVLLALVLCSRAIAADAGVSSAPDGGTALHVYQSVVSAERLPRTASEQSIRGPLLKAVPTRGGDDLLRSVPGLLVSRHGNEGKGYQIFLRGFDAAHGADLEVTLEGIPLNEFSNVHGQGYLDLGLILGDAVSRIRVIKGPFDVEQGAFATAGSVQFELGGGEVDRTALGYEFGSTLRHRLSGVHSRQRNVLAAEAVADQGYGENRDLRRAGLLGAWTGPQLAGGSLRFIGALYGADFGEPGVVPLASVESGRLGFYDVYSERTRGRSLRALAGASYSARPRFGKLEALAWAQARSLSLEDDFTGFLLNPIQGDARRQSQEARGGGGRLLLESRLGRAKLQAGASWLTERVNQSETLLGPELQALQQTRAEAFWQHAGGVWAALKFRPVDPLLVEFGARGDLFHFELDDAAGEGAQGSATLAEPSPRLQLGFEVTEALTVFASVGRGIRPPEARAVTERGSAEITVADAAELGTRLLLGRSIALSASAFYTAIEREQLFDHLAGVSVEQGATRRPGVELVAHWQPTGWFELRGDLTLVDARFAETGEPVPGAPRLLAGLLAGLVHPDGWQLGGRLLVLGPRPLAYGATAAPALIFDLSAGYRWRQIELTLEIENVTDARWREGEFHYASWFDRSAPRSELPQLHFAAGPPRNARLGLAYHFD